MKILILGNGYLANKFSQAFPSAILSKARIEEEGHIYDELIEHSPSVLINCIGRTGEPNIDWCEQNKRQTFFSNVMVPFMIQRACEKMGVKMVHIGTGCIYDGEEPYSEEDFPTFKNSFYSRTKYICEEGLKEFDVLQIRIRMPIDYFPHRRNLLTKLLNYPQTINRKNSITIVPDLMRATNYLIAHGATGIFNVVNPQPVTHTQILDIYNKYSSTPKHIREISMDRLNNMTIAGRSNCVLSTKKIEEYGHALPNTIDSLNECIERYVKNEESFSVI